MCKVFSIERISSGLYSINHSRVVSITEPVDKELVNRYYILLFDIRHIDCLFRITSRGLLASKRNVSIKVNQVQNDLWKVVIGRNYIDGIGRFYTKYDKRECTYRQLLNTFIEVFG